MAADDTLQKGAFSFLTISIFFQMPGLFFWSRFNWFTVKDIKAADLHELRLAHETSNMILSAEMKLKTSLMRKESRCSHFRLDYPEPDYKNWNVWINIFKGDDGSMKFEKQKFNTWPS